MVNYHDGHGSTFNFNRKVKSALKYDNAIGKFVLVFDVDNSDYHFEDIIRGKAILSDDEFTINYFWDSSFNYEGSLPRKGTLIGEGVKIN